MPAPHHPKATMSTTQKPTRRQLAYLKALAQRTGQTFTYPKTIADASVEIARLKQAQPSTRAERRIEHKAVADQIQGGTGDATRVRHDEISGRGASATWTHNRERSIASATPGVARRAPTVGVRTELARYTIPAGERILYGQRIDGVVRVTDRPAQPDGRSYLVERGLETKGELDALVADYLRVAADLGDVPAGHVPLDRYLDVLK
jgi:hypothetical protein